MAETAARKRSTDQTALGVTGAGAQVSTSTKTLQGQASAPQYTSSIGATTNDITSLSQALARQYENAQYSVRTGEERQAQAQLEYGTYYDQLRRAATQQQEQNDLRLQQQRDALQASYDRTRMSTAQQYNRAYSQTDRQLLSRGMARSSYGAQTLAGVAMQGAQAQGEIDRQQNEAEANIEDQRTQLYQQLQQTLAGYESEQAKDILKRVNELEETDYEREVKAAERQTNIAQQLYSNLYQQQRDTVADAQWLQTFNENARQFNLNKHYKQESGYLTGTGTNTAADTYYSKTSSTKKKSSSSGSGSGGDGTSSSKKKKKTGDTESLLDKLNRSSGDVDAVTSESPSVSDANRN